MSNTRKPGAPRGNQNARKKGRTEVLNVRVTPAIASALNTIAARENGENKSDLVHRALQRLILEEYPDVNPQDDHRPQ